MLKQKWCNLVNSTSVETQFKKKERINKIVELLQIAPDSAKNTDEYMYLVKLKQLLLKKE